jgi:hypothetical protein
VKKQNTVFEYAVVRFMPFIETREFANVGIVVIEPKSGCFGYKLAPKRFGRVTTFFEGIDKQLYKQSLDNFEAELIRVKDFIRCKNVRGKELVTLFREVTRKRESVLHFGAVGRLMGSEIDTTLSNLFQRFVARDFVTPKYREQQMVKALRETLATQITHKYYERKLKAGVYEFKLPFVSNTDEGKRVIKPLAFDQKTAMNAADHGHNWLNRMKALVNKGIVEAGQALVTVEKPQKSKHDFFDVYEEVTGKLLEVGIQLEQFENTDKIIEFARGSDMPAEHENYWQ